MLGGQINVLLTLDNGQFTIATQKAGQTVQELKRSIDQTSRSTEALENHFTGLGGRFRSVVQTASMLRYAMHDVHDIFMALPGAILKTSGEIEKLTKLMEGMSKESTKAARQAEALSNVKFVFNMAQNAPFEVKALTDSFVKLKSGGIDPTNGSMMALVNSVAKFGGTTETLHRASIAIQQMSGKGVISMEELRQQLGEAVPNAINLMAEGAGQSVEVFAKKVSDGTVQASMALQNMFTVMTIENAGAAAEMMDSWTGMLSLLKTKFELFKNDAGKAGFFDEAKKGIQDIIDMFDTMGGKSLSFDIGRGLGDAVIAVRELINFFSEWGATMKTVGELFLLYYGSQRLMQLGAGIKSFADARVAAYQKEVTAARDAARASADALRDQAFNMRAKAQMEETNAARSTQLAGQLYAEQARYSNQIADLERRNLGWAGQQKIDRLTARRDETRAAIVEIQTEAVARRQQADEIRKVADAHDRMAEATRAGTTASRQDIAVVNQTTAERKKATDVLNQKAAAAVSAGNGISFMGRAMMGVSSVVNAFGGWINVAIMALGFMVAKLREALTFWDRVQEAVDAASQGVTSKEKEADTEAAIKRRDAEIAGLEKIVNSPNRKARVTDEAISAAKRAGNSGLAEMLTAEQMMFDQQNQDLKNAIDAREVLRKTAATQQRVKSQNEDDVRVNTERRALEAENNALFREATDKINKIRKDIADSKTALIKEANAAGKEVSAAQLAKVSDAGLKQITALQLEVIAGSLANLREVQRKTNEALKTATPEQAKTLNARLTALSNEQGGLIEKAELLAKQSETLGKSSNVGKDTKDKDKKPLEASLVEDPLVRLAEKREAAVALAKAKLAATVANARDLVALQNEATIKVLGDMAAGEYDSTDVDADGKKRVRDFVGGQDARKEYVAKFAAALAEGKGDIDTFINGLENLKEKSKIIEEIKGLATQMQLAESQKAMSQAQQEERRTLEDLNAARSAYASDGLAKESAGMIALEKKFADLRATLKAGTDDFAAFDKAKANAFANQAISDALGFGIDAKKSLRAATLEQVKGAQTVGEARKYEFDQNIKRINEEATKREDDLKKAITLNEADADRKKELEEELTRVKQNATQARLAAEIDYANKSRTAMDELARNWRDSTTQMNQLSANWASGFMDRLVNVIAGGSFKWKEFAAGMAKDLLAVSLKENLGGMITKSFGSFSSSVGGMLGIGSNTAAQTAQTTAVTTAMTTMTGATTVAMSAVNAGVAAGQTAQTAAMTTAMTAMTSATTVAMGAMTAEVAAGMAAMAAAAAGKSIGSMFGFANGGIMTGSGAMPLKKYANGGIATGPQLALFGEGSMNEAYVPLPDGRSIPVTMSGTGGATSQNNVSISITVNKDGSESASAAGSDGKVWQQMAQKVRGVVMEEMVTQQRPGGLLYNR